MPERKDQGAAAGAGKSEYLKAEKGIFADFAKLALLWPFLKGNRATLVWAVLLVPVIAGLQMAAPLVMQRAIDHGVMARDGGELRLYAGLYLAVVLLSFAGRSSQSILMSLAVYRMIRDLRTRLVTHILSLRARFHDKNLSGVLVTRATSDFDNLSESLNMGILTSVVDIAVLVGSVVGMLILDLPMALFVVALLPLIGYMISAFSKALKRGTMASRRKLADLNGFSQEALYGVGDLQVLNAEPYARRRFGALNLSYRDAQMKVVILDAVMFSVIDGFSSIALGVFLWLVVTRFFGSEVATAGILIAFVQYINKVFDPVKNLGQRMAVLQGAFTAIDRIFGLLDVKELIGGDEDPGRIKGGVEFLRVSFRYGEGDPLVLNEVSFNIAPGTKAAFVGRTGSGKTSVIKLLTKLYDGYSGSILLDGREVSSLSGTALRRQIAVVPQDVVIFDGSIRFNITLGDEGIGDDAVSRSLELVGMGPLMRRLPEGLDHHLKEQGGNLSAGERQLIVFARAVVKDPAILILDEATANVDPESERLIQRATEKVFLGRTAIVIAHRLKTIEACEQIIVLKDGRILEHGSHGELLKAKGAYQAMLMDAPS